MAKETTAKKTNRKKTTGRGSKSPEVRSSGMTPGQEEAAKGAKDLDQTVGPETNLERERRFQSPGFSRMRFTWRSQDYSIIKRAIDISDARIIDLFSDAYELMHEVYDFVRAAEVDTKTGEIKVDNFGFKVWKRTSTGGYDEDFTRLTNKQKEDFLFKITTRLFEWEQRAANLWLESMMAKGQWEEEFAFAFDTDPGGKTIEDHTAYANRTVAEDKYFAIFQTALSRKADAIVRTMALLGQRIKDSME